MRTCVMMSWSLLCVWGSGAASRRVMTIRIETPAADSTAFMARVMTAGRSLVPPGCCAAAAAALRLRFVSICVRSSAAMFLRCTAKQIKAAAGANLSARRNRPGRQALTEHAVAHALDNGRPRPVSRGDCAALAGWTRSSGTDQQGMCAGGERVNAVDALAGTEGYVREVRGAQVALTCRRLVPPMLPFEKLLQLHLRLHGVSDGLAQVGQ